jgi:hypothetical protein
VLEQAAGRAGDVHVGYALGSGCHHAGRIERHAQVPGLGLQDPAGELAQSGRHGLGRVQDDLDVRAGTLTTGTGMSASSGATWFHFAVQFAYSVFVFDPGLVSQDRPGADPDRLLVAEITGEARHRAGWRPLTGEEEAAALAELRALAGGRAGLLAQVAGIFEGTSEGEPDEPLARSAARLCRMAGADAGAIPGWIEEGRRRSANARRPPFSGGLSP